MSLERDIAILARNTVNKGLSSVHTSMPAQVVSYNGETNTCSIQPCIRRVRSKDPNNDTIALPQLDDIPVQQFGSGKTLVSTPPQPDSYGWYIVSERSIEDWISDGGIVDPSSSEKFGFSDGVFLPGTYHLTVDGDNGKIANGIETDRTEIRTRSGETRISVVDDDTIEIKNGSTTITIDGGDISITGGSTVSINGGVDAAALSSKVDALWTKLYTLFTVGWVTVPTDGGAALKTAFTAAFSAPPTTVASSHLKVDS